MSSWHEHETAFPNLNPAMRAGMQPQKVTKICRNKNVEKRVCPQLRSQGPLSSGRVAIWHPQSEKVPFSAMFSHPAKQGLK